MQVHADVETLFYTLFHSSKKKKLTKRTITQLLAMILYVHYWKLQKSLCWSNILWKLQQLLCQGFFGYIFTTGQSNKANRVKLLKKFSYIHEFQPFRQLFLFFKLYLTGYEKSVNDHLQLCPGHWLGHSKTVRYSLWLENLWHFLCCML